MTITVLMVAEKPSLALAIAGILSDQQASQSIQLVKFNSDVHGSLYWHTGSCMVLQQCQMRHSVSASCAELFKKRLPGGA